MLKDNVELHLESGAMLISSLNPADITPFPQGGDGTDPDDTADGWEGGFFLGASHAKNVTISGMGTIYGQGDKVFLDKDADNGFHECRQKPPLLTAAGTFCPQDSLQCAVGANVVVV